MAEESGARARHPIRRALLSVHDKRGLTDLAAALVSYGVELIATGGTLRAIRERGLAAREVAEYTGFPEMMDGRVKTLHPVIHGGILARRAVDRDALARHGIQPIDLVVVNLYPFEHVIARPGATRDAAIENIDIGGPAMLRSAAKNHVRVLAIVDPDDYIEVQRALADGGSSAELRVRMAAKAFHHTARYDAIVASYFSGDEGELPTRLTLAFDKLVDLRYGENPHQSAALYVRPGRGLEPGVAGAHQLQGKQLSYLNLLDADAALECVRTFAEPACVIVKHANPCGVATATDIALAYEHAYTTDPTSAFGGIIAFNRPLGGELLTRIVERQVVDVIVAPAMDEQATQVASRRKNLRLLVCGQLDGIPRRGLELHRVSGGMLVQTPDEQCFGEPELRVVTRRAPSEEERADLLFAWRVAWSVKSNAIVYAKGRRTIGIGAGQTSRVVAARVAALKAADGGHSVAGCVMASDAFLPFRDGLDAAASAGVTAVIQPGGSVRDAEVVAAADEHGMAMVFTGVRQFRH